MGACFTRIQSPNNFYTIFNFYTICQICHVDTDAVQNQLVGNVKAPLLKVVPLKDGNVTYVHYNKPNFLPISRSNISFVKLNKKNERGNLHSFQSGISIITLLF